MLKLVGTSGVYHNVPLMFYKYWQDLCRECCWTISLLLCHHSGANVFWCEGNFSQSRIAHVKNYRAILEAGLVSIKWWQWQQCATAIVPDCLVGSVLCCVQLAVLSVSVTWHIVSGGQILNQIVVTNS